MVDSRITPEIRSALDRYKKAVGSVQELFDKGGFEKGYGTAPLHQILMGNTPIDSLEGNIQQLVIGHTDVSLSKQAGLDVMQMEPKVARNYVFNFKKNLNANSREAYKAFVTLKNKCDEAGLVLSEDISHIADESKFFAFSSNTSPAANEAITGATPAAPNIEAASKAEAPAGASIEATAVEKTAAHLNGDTVAASVILPHQLPDEVITSLKNAHTLHAQWGLACTEKDALREPLLTELMKALPADGGLLKDKGREYELQSLIAYQLPRNRVITHDDILKALKSPKIAPVLIPGHDAESLAKELTPLFNALRPAEEKQHQIYGKLTAQLKKLGLTGKSDKIVDEMEIVNKRLTDLKIFMTANAAPQKEPAPNPGETAVAAETADAPKGEPTPPANEAAAQQVAASEKTAMDAAPKNAAVDPAMQDILGGTFVDPHPASKAAPVEAPLVQPQPKPEPVLEIKPAATAHVPTELEKALKSMEPKEVESLLADLRPHEAVRDKLEAVLSNNVAPGMDAATVASEISQYCSEGLSLKETLELFKGKKLAENCDTAALQSELEPLFKNAQDTYPAFEKAELSLIPHVERLEAHLPELKELNRASAKIRRAEEIVAKQAAALSPGGAHAATVGPALSEPAPAVKMAAPAEHPATATDSAAAAADTKPAADAKSTPPADAATTTPKGEAPVEINAAGEVKAPEPAADSAKSAPGPKDAAAPEVVNPIDPPAPEKPHTGLTEEPPVVEATPPAPKAEVKPAEIKPAGTPKVFVPAPDHELVILYKNPKDKALTTSIEHCANRKEAEALIIKLEKAGNKDIAFGWARKNPNGKGYTLVRDVALMEDFESLANHANANGLEERFKFLRQTPGAAAENFVANTTGGGFGESIRNSSIGEAFSGATSGIAKSAERTGEAGLVLATVAGVGAAAFVGAKMLAGKLKHTQQLDMAKKDAQIAERDAQNSFGGPG